MTHPLIFFPLRLIIFSLKAKYKCILIPAKLYSAPLESKLHKKRQMVAISSQVSRSQISTIRLLATILLIILQRLGQEFHPGKCSGLLAVIDEPFVAILQHLDIGFRDGNGVYEGCLLYTSDAADEMRTV